MGQTRYCEEGLKIAVRYFFSRGRPRMQEEKPSTTPSPNFHYPHSLTFPPPATQVAGYIHKRYDGSMQGATDRGSSDSDANSEANADGMELPDAGKIGRTCYTFAIPKSNVVNCCTAVLYRLTWPRCSAVVGILASFHVLILIFWYWPWLAT